MPTIRALRDAQTRPGLITLRDLTQGESEPTGSRITEAVGAGVSSELCEAVANILEAESITALNVAFTWAERLPTSSAVEPVQLENEAVSRSRHISSILNGEPVIGRQTVVR